MHPVSVYALLVAAASWQLVSCSGDPSCAESGTCAPPAADDGQTTDAGVAALELTVTVAPTILAGTTVDLEVTIARGGAEGRVTLELAPETGITAAPVVVEADASKATMKVVVSADRRHGKVPLVVRGTAEANGRTAEATVTTLVRGKPGSVDTSFGVDGTFTFDKAESEATGVVVQSDGKIVLGGRAGEELAIVRLLEDGTVDTSFAGGATTMSPPGEHAGVFTSDVVADRNDGLAFAFSVQGSVFESHILKLTRDGKPDSTFGSGGTGIATVAASVPASLAIAPDGSLYLGGRYNEGGGQYVLKLKPNGERDESWGDGGSYRSGGAGACIGSNQGNCYTRVVAVEPSGTILACQPRNDGSSVHRIDTSGKKDDIDVSTSLLVNECRSLAFDPVTPRFAFVGGGGPGEGGPLGVLRVAPEGMSAGTWGNTASRFSAPADSGLIYARRLAPVEDKLVIGAEAEVDGAPAFGVARLTRHGTLDTSFAEKGYVTFKVDGKTSTLKAMAIDALGRIIVAGTNGRMVAVRLWP